MMNKLLLLLLSLCCTASLEAATISNWGVQLPTAVPSSGDAILMQKGGITYYFTPNQLATQLSTNAALYAVISTTSNGLVALIEGGVGIGNLNGLGTNTTFAGAIGTATNLWQLLGTNGLPLVFITSNQVMTVSNTLVVSARPQSTTTVPLTIAGSQGQDANLFNVKDYLGNVLFAISYDGTFSDPRLASPSMAGALWTATDDIGNGAWSTNLTPQNLSISNVIASKALVLNANKQVTNAATSSAALDNFFAMGITNVVASTGIALATNNGTLVITNTGLTTTSNATFSGIVTGETVRATNIYDQSNVKFWGAVGDGITDDTIAIQAAVNSVANLQTPSTSLQSGGKIYLPSGVYVVTNAIRLHEGVEIIGDGRESTVLLNKGATNDVLYYNSDLKPYYSSGVVGIRGLTIRSTNASSGAAIRLMAATNSIWGLLEDMYIYGGYDGIVIDYSTQTRVLNCLVQGMTNNGIVMQNFASANKLDSCYVTGCGGSAFLLHEGYYCNVMASVFESSGYGLHVLGGYGNTLTGTGAEECSVASVNSSNSLALTISGGDFFHTSAGVDGIRLDGGSAVLSGFNVRKSTTPSGFALCITNTSGAFPSNVICQGLILAAFGGGSINDASKISAWTGTNATWVKSGLFGINTATPTEMLDVAGAGFFHGAKNSSPNINGIYLHTVGINGLISAANFASGYRDLTLQGNDLIFGANGGSALERMRIMGATGHVGIGTSNALERLHVVGGIVQTNGGIWQTWSLSAPSAPATQGAVLWNDGTNWCSVFRNAAGALSTNKLSMTAWP